MSAEPPSPVEAPEPVVVVDRVSKRYSRDLRQAQRGGISAILGEFRRGKAPDAPLREGEFWALRDVSFQVAAGEAVGIVGRNGAGKSTLLRLVAGITSPTTGEVRCRGTVASLLDPNAGFDQVLTGRENVQTVFSLLGGERASNEMIERITAYAGLEDAIDHPVRTYSQGMKLRLGFSSIVHVDPDVLLIDEALAVGDTSFQMQCLDYLHAYCRAGGALLFVSHSMWLFQHLAVRGIHIDGGQLALAGPADEVADHYVSALQDGSWVDSGSGPDILEREQMLPASAAAEDAAEELADSQGESQAPVVTSASQRRPVQFRSIEVSGPDGPARTGEPAEVRFELESSEVMASAELAFTIWTADLSMCVTADVTHGRGGTDATFPLDLGRAVVTCRIADLPLQPGQYAIRAAIYDGETSDVMGMRGFEDTPHWLEIEPPLGGPNVIKDAGHRLRTLRAMEAEPWQLSGSGAVQAVETS